jgi:NTE family protein
MTYAFKNLVFEGGGMKGLAYLGALEVLNKK